MHNSHLKKCEHKLKYCEQCDVVYCEVCGMEWKKESSTWTSTTWPPNCTITYHALGKSYYHTH